MFNSYLIIPLLAVCLIHSEEASSQDVNVTMTIDNQTIVVSLKASDAELLAAVLRTPNAVNVTYDINECKTPILHECPENQTCIDLPKDGTPEGGYRCEEDQCAFETDNCSENATCSDTDDSFRCECKVGYEGNGTYCKDVDECINSIEHCDTDSNAICINTGGSYQCECKAGYEKNGTYCEVSECIDSFCGENADCKIVSGGVLCDCKNGYHDKNSSNPGTLCVDPVANVSCGEAGNIDIKLYANYLYNNGINRSSLPLSDPTCTMSIDGEFLTFTTKNDGCGDNVELIGSSTLSSNESISSISGIIINDFQINFSIVCNYTIDFNSTSGCQESENGLTTTKVIDSGQENGGIPVQFGMFVDATFVEVLTCNVSVDVGQRLYLKAHHSLSGTSIYIVLDACWLTPSSDPTSSPQVAIIDSSCPTENGMVSELRNGVAEDATFSMTVKFDYSSAYYLHCEVRLCSGDCQKDCSSSRIGRRQRQAEDIQQNTLSIGPVSQAPSTSSSSPATSMSTTTFAAASAGIGFAWIGILGAVLLVVALILLIICYKKRCNRSSEKGADSPNKSNTSENVRRSNGHRGSQNNDSPTNEGDFEEW